jgi:endonuclease/exonuclease/phosphatase family metal-dependent hydrolase
MMRRLRVVSWNVGRVYTRDGDNRLDPADIPQVARTLHELDGDVILLQELVDDAQLGRIQKRLDGYSGAIADRCGYDRHVAALVRTRLEPAFQQHSLAPTRRGAVLAEFTVAGARAVALPVHFDAFERARRRTQAEALAALTDGRAEPLVVVGGDFNFDPEWAHRTDDALDRGTWRLLTERFQDAGGAAGPTLLGLLRVDHVLARGPLVRRLAVRISPRRRLPLGDHDPVVCDIEIGA